MSPPEPPAALPPATAPAEHEAEASERARARLGSTIAGRWHLDSVLGIGGMANVYGATDPQGRRAAIKILHPELGPVPGIRERFLREAEVSRQVGHPGCVAFVDEGTTEQGEPYLGMELLAGRTLEALCLEHGGRLPVGEALRIARAVLDALGAFHARAIVHRDLKPANIFITDDGRVKLLDLGIAQLREAGRDATRPGLAVGTPAYMSPEQAMGRRHLVDGRSDVYSLGATLHVVLSGVRLHHGVSDDEALVRAATQPAASLARAAPELPIDVIALVDKALQWDRRNRFQSAGEMAEVVDRLLRELGATAAPGSAAASLAPESWRRIELELLPVSQPVVVVPLAETPSVPPSDSGALELESLPPPRGAPALPAALRHPPPVSAPARLMELEPDEAELDADVGPEPPPAAEDLHPLGALFERIDRLLRTARQYGPAHPETQSRIEPVYRAIVAATEGPAAEVRWRVLPFCFMHDEVVVWEPAPPGDLVPYTLSVAGLREVRILPGVSEEEIRDLFGAMMIDANTDPADVAATLWEAPFARVECRLEEDLPRDPEDADDDLAADAEDLLHELRQELDVDPSGAQRLARSMARGDLVEAAAMASAIDAARASAAAALAIDPETEQALMAELGLPSEQLGPRHVDVVLAAWADALGRRDSALVASTFEALARRLIRTGRHEELFMAHAALLERLAEPPAATSRPWPAASLLTAALFPDDVLRHVVHMVTLWSHLLTPEHVELALGGLRRVTGSLGPEALPRCLRIVHETPDGQALDLLLEYVVRVAPAERPLVMAELETLAPLVAQRLLARLVAAAGPAAKDWTAPLLHSAHAVLRCEAIALCSRSSDQLCAELLKLFASDVAELRLAALETFVRHRVVSAGPALVRLVQHDSFPERPLAEQRSILDALYALHPRRTESLLASILDRHGLIPDGALDETRMLALELLGAHGASSELHEVALAATRRRPWNTAKLREVAAAAARAIEQRLASDHRKGEGAP